MNKSNLKKGDFIFCKTSYSICELGKTFSYKEGDVWKVLRIDNKEHYAISAEDTAGEIKGGYYNFTWEEMNNWMDLAEWRDKQIDSILND